MRVMTNEMEEVGFFGSFVLLKIFEMRGVA